jgi:hypothetical protein
MRPDRKPEDCVKSAEGSHALVDPRTSLVVFESGPPARMTPTAPLGPWALPSLERIMRAAEPGCTLTLDLRQAEVADPASVAAVLWADDNAREGGVALEVLVPDMVSAELLDFAGVDAPVYAPGEQPLVDPVVRRASAY